MLIDIIAASNVPLAILLFALGVAAAVIGPRRWPSVGPIGYKLMAAPVFLIPLLAEIEWLARPPLPLTGVLSLVLALSSIALIAVEVACLVWLVRAPFKASSGNSSE